MNTEIKTSPAATGKTTAFANLSNEIYERLTTVFECTEFDVHRSLKNSKITISRLMYDADGEFKADIDIEFKDGYATVDGYFDGLHSEHDELSVSTESNDVDTIYEKIEDAICVAYGKIAENEMRGWLLQYYNGRSWLKNAKKLDDIEREAGEKLAKEFGFESVSELNKFIEMKGLNKTK